MFVMRRSTVERTCLLLTEACDRHMLWTKSTRRYAMPFALPGVGSMVAAIVAIVLGVIMLIKPQIVAYLIGAYLIFIGIMFFIQQYVIK